MCRFRKCSLYIAPCWYPEPHGPRNENIDDALDHGHALLFGPSWPVPAGAFAIGSSVTDQHAHRGAGGDRDSVGAAADGDGVGGGADGDSRARPTDHGRRLKTLGDYIRLQRNLANLSMRQMAELAQISNPYLSQIERGVHEPSMHILSSIARALGVSIESLLTEAGLMDPRSDGQTPEMERAIRHDPHLSEAQKSALLAVYRSYVGQSARVDQTPEDPPSRR